MLAASKAKTPAAKAYARREPFEDKLVRCEPNYSCLKSYSLCKVASNFSPEAYNNYVMYERKARNVDFDMLSILYERAIADTAKRRLEDIESTEYVLRTFWSGYCDVVVSQHYGIVWAHWY